VIGNWFLIIDYRFMRLKSHFHIKALSFAPLALSFFSNWFLVISSTPSHLYTFQKALCFMLYNQCYFFKKVTKNFVLNAILGIVYTKKLKTKNSLCSNKFSFFNAFLHKLS